jgi:hypothetical protein
MSVVAPVERELLARLARPHAAPAVSLLIPLDHERPGNREDPRRIAAMRDGVLDALDCDRRPNVDAVVDRLDEVLAHIDLRHPIPGLAVLVAPDTSAVLHLRFAPRSSVVVGAEFAFAAVIEALQHDVRARALLVNRGETRCVDIDPNGVSEREDHGFPVRAIVRGSVGNPHEDLPAGERPRAEDALATFRAVWSATVALQRDDPRELVVIGTARDLAALDEIRGSEVPIAAQVRASHAWDRTPEIAGVARAALDVEHADAVRALCDAARAGIGHGVVDGIGAVWTAARAGRGHRLLVEPGLRHPMWARDDDLLGPADPGAAAHPDHADAVDGAISDVLARGGDVVVVPDGALTTLGRIALFTLG